MATNSGPAYRAKAIGRAKARGRARGRAQTMPIRLPLQACCERTTFRRQKLDRCNSESLSPPKVVPPDIIH